MPNCFPLGLLTHHVFDAIITHTGGLSTDTVVHVKPEHYVEGSRTMNRLLKIFSYFIICSTFGGKISGNAEILRDLNKYPVCIVDKDCSEISKQNGKDYRCFQYMCFPWQDIEEEDGFRKCQGREDCKGLNGEEDGDCLRHREIKLVDSGMCLSKRFIIHVLTVKKD